MKKFLTIAALLFASTASAEEVYIPQNCWKPVMSELTPGLVLYYNRVEHDKDCIDAIAASYQADAASDRERDRADKRLEDWLASLEEEEEEPPVCKASRTSIKNDGC